MSLQGVSKVLDNRGQQQIPTKTEVTRRAKDILNLDGNKIEFVLWNEMALNFDMELYEALPKPVLIVVSSCRVSSYGDKNFGTEFLKELEDKDPYHFSALITSLEGKHYIFKFHLNPSSKAGQIDFIVDKHTLTPKTLRCHNASLITDGAYGMSLSEESLDRFDHSTVGKDE
ncbi:hypothetical protein Tco_0016621 [Tanacetum coccineum]